MSEEARKAERLEVEKIRKQDLKQLTEELFHKFQGMNTQPPFRANQETGDPDISKFPKENQDRISQSAIDRDEQTRVEQETTLKFFNEQKLRDEQNKDREDVILCLQQQREDKQAEYEAHNKKRKEEEDAIRAEKQREMRDERGREQDKEKLRKAEEDVKYGAKRKE